MLFEFRVDASLKKIFFKKARSYGKPTQVMRALLRNYAHGDRPPAKEVIEQESHWEKAGLRASRFGIPIETELLERVQRRAGLIPVAALARALMKEFCNSVREVSTDGIKFECLQARTRRQKT